VTIFVPGRANIIGEHTDYNEGLSLPMAIQLGVTITVTLRDDSRVLLASDGYEAAFLDDVTADSPTHLRLGRAVADRFGVTGVEWHVTSTLPAGSGLSSSAAYLGALVLATDYRADTLTVARVMQEIEAACGSDVGLLDQLAVLHTQQDHALRIDFVDNLTSDVPLPANWSWSAVHSGEHRSLAETRYAQRRSECDAIRAQLGPWRSLSLDDIGSLDDEILVRRARHVVTETARVDEMIQAMAKGDIEMAGAILNASHASLRDDFAVSTPGIDALTHALQSTPGVYGARLMGGGFGGCLLVLHREGVSMEDIYPEAWRLVPSAGALR